MPIIKSAKKAARQATKRTLHNQQIKKFIKLALKNFKNNPTAENLSKAQSEYDKAAKKGLIKKNTASRRKAALVKIAKQNKVTFAKKEAKVSKAPAKSAAKKAEPAAKKATKAKTEKAKVEKAPAKKSVKATKAK